MGEKQSEKAFRDQRFTSQGHYLVVEIWINSTESQSRG